MLFYIKLLIIIFNFELYLTANSQNYSTLLIFYIIRGIFELYLCSFFGGIIFTITRFNS